MQRFKPSRLLRFNLKSSPAYQGIRDGQSVGKSKENNKGSSTPALGKVFLERARLLFFYFWENSRLRWGIITLLVIAPLSKFVYLIFPENGFGDYLIQTSFVTIHNFLESESWIYLNLHYFCYTLGETWSPLIALYGVFLLFPKNYYPSYLVGVPFGYFLGILFGKATASSNHEIMSNTMTPGTLFMVTIFGIAAFIISDRLLFRKNHRTRASEARILGLINMPGVSWADKEELIKSEAKKLMKEDNELFNRSA